MSCGRSASLKAPIGAALYVVGSAGLLVSFLLEYVGEEFQRIGSRIVGRPW